MKITSFLCYWCKIQIPTNNFPATGTTHKLRETIPIPLYVHGCREAIENQVTTDSKCH